MAKTKSMRTFAGNPGLGKDRSSEGPEGLEGRPETLDLKPLPRPRT